MIHHDSFHTAAQLMNHFQTLDMTQFDWILNHKNMNERGRTDFFGRENLEKYFQNVTTNGELSDSK